MTGPRATLHSLSRPLAALGVLLTVLATVVPVVARADGGFCIGAGATFDPDSVGVPDCDACLPAALLAPSAHALPDRGRACGAVTPAGAIVIVSRAPEAERIRGPPAD